MADIDAKIAELKAATREANETLKALNQAKREFGQAVAEARAETKAWQAACKKQLQEETNKGLEEYHKELSALVGRTEKRVLARFEALLDLLTRKTPVGGGEMVSVEDLVALKTGNAVPLPSPEKLRGIKVDSP